MDFIYQNEYIVCNVLQRKNFVAKRAKRKKRYYLNKL